MIYLLGEMSNGTAKLRAARARGWGRVFVDGTLDPATSNTFPLRGEPWALDNGAFRGWRASASFPGPASADELPPYFERFEARLERAAELAAEGHAPLFAVAPDLPAHPDSLAFTLDWMARVGSRYPGVPFYLALQDGMTPDDLEPHLGLFVGLFLGGSDDFKAEAPEWAAFARRHGLRFHFGRATKSRIPAALAVGADSADSSHPLRLGADRWAGFLAAWDGRRQQTTFNLEAA